MTAAAKPNIESPNYLEEVRAHYENFPYPLVNPEDEKERLYGTILEAFDRLNHFCYEGKRDFTKPFRALVAGGGTGDAAVHLAEQFRGLPAEIIYLDMSLASMEVAKERMRMRGLDNVTWIHDSLLNIPKLGLGQFDFINCSGVLHHLADPDAGLKILADALKEDGAMGIMVYAKYGRAAVYPLQEALSMINRDEPNLQQRVDNAKSILSHLPLTNWFHHSPHVLLQEVRSDVGIFDLLLHSQDRAYSVPELYQFMSGADLTILHMFSDDFSLSGGLYKPSTYIRDENVLKRANALSQTEQQQLSEILHAKIYKHSFYAAKRRPPSPDPDNLDVIPLFSFDIFDGRERVADIIRDAPDMAVRISQEATGVSVILAKTPHLEAMVRLIDGKRSLREIFRKIMDAPGSKKTKPNFQTLHYEFKALYNAFHHFNWMYLRCKESSPVLYPDEMQKRVPK
ncbi:MAG: class I SAM-dependent methyltransferase [Alphaproteobacteria bacterium]